MNDKPALSIVIPAYNEENNLSALYRELIKVLPLLNESWEIVFSDDGSNDNTWEEIKSLHAKDERVIGIRLSRNFGHQYALISGMSVASGKAVISMDADLQHPPQLIPQLVDEWQKGSKIVNTIRSDPEDYSFFKKAMSKRFYRFFSLLSGVKIKEGMADYRLLDRQVVESILKLTENGIFLRGIVQWLGYPSSTLNYQSLRRFQGKSKYTIIKMIKLATDGITSFSIIPLRLGIIIGLLTSILAFGGLVYALISKIFFPATTQSGWASAVSIISFLFGILFILIGLIGEYIGRILVEVKSRPRFIISDQVGISASHDR